MRTTFSPGDIILMSGSAPIHHFVERVTSHKWSQVGMVIYVAEYNLPLLFECTSIPIAADIDSGKFITGVSTTDLRARLGCFIGTAAVRKVRPRLGASTLERLAEFRGQVINRPFNFNKLESRKSLRREHQTFNADSFICSSLVAAALQYAGVMRPPPEGPFPNNVLPGDFANNHSLALADGYSFGQEQIIMDLNGGFNLSRYRRILKVKRVADRIS